VFGGKGFLGSYLVTELEKYDYEVSTFDIKKDPSMDATRFNAVLEFLYRKKPDIVINLAALTGACGKGGKEESLKRPYAFLYTNILIVLNILESMRILGIKYLIHMSSLSVHGNQEDIREDSTFTPRDPYGVSKACCEIMCKLYSDLYNIKIAVVRAPLIVGAGQKELNALREFVLCALKNKTLVIFGDGTHEREWIHPRDVAQGIIKVIEWLNKGGESYKVFLLGAPQNRVSMKALAELIIKKVGKGRIAFKNPERTYRSQRTHPFQTFNLLNWKPKISLDEIIDEVIDDISKEISKESDSNDTNS